MPTAATRIRPPAPFRCHVRRDGHTAWLRLVGELDIETVPAAEDELRSQLNAGAKRIVLDLSGLTFMDSTGVRLMLRWDAAARSDGFAFGVVSASPPVRRVFELTHTADRFDLSEPE
jgi:anti-sigma B factor antagonist